MKIFYTIDENSRVFPCCDWSEDIIPNFDWFIGEMPGNAYEKHGIPLYKKSDKVIVARTAAEIQADIDALPPVEPTIEEVLQADVDFLTMENEYFEEVMEQQQADIDFCLMMLEE